MTGRIFDIQRFSVHDGPGIRTTVFMKGCPLRCRWCHNPEGLSHALQLQHFDEKCIGCGRCRGSREISAAKACPAKALSVCGRDVSVDEVISEIRKDEIFYKDNGGVTFSGGECLMQADFVVAVLTEAKKLGLNTAIDTSGYVAWEEIEKTLDVCDLYLYDVKCIDPEYHKKYTGVDNARILDNLTRLSSTGKDIWIRVPVIPDFNDRPEEMEAIASFVATLDGVRQTTLMPYHTLGENKYRTLGLEYTYKGTAMLAKDRLEDFKKIFEKRDILLK